MGEKDYLGEKLRLRERGEEQRYFAERDRELIAKLRQAHVAEQEETFYDLVRFRCPQCGERLHQHAFHAVTVEECTSCHGVWLDQASLQTIAQRKGEEWTEHFLEGLVRVILHPAG